MELKKIKWDEKMAERCLMRWNIEEAAYRDSAETIQKADELQWEEFKKTLDILLGK